MTIDLSSVEETCSLLVPAYGITHDVPGELDVLDPMLCIGPRKDEGETYGLLHRDDWYLQPRGTAQFLFGASALFNEAIGHVGERRIVRLREAAEAMPDGRANTCLMVEGMRNCVRRHQDRCEYVRGYAAWAGPEGAHRWVSHSGLSSACGSAFFSKTVLFGRVGRGALYAPVGDGKARVLLIDFHVADRDEASPDLLLIWSSCTELRIGGIPHVDPRGTRLDDDWHALISRAVAGYRLEHGP